MSQITRRDFLKILNRTLTVTGLAAIAAPILAYFYPPSLEETPSEPVLVGAESDLPLNSGKTIRYGRYPALVVNTSEGLRAYSAVCTHFACIVKWDPEKGQIACPCHAGYFDPLDGHVLAGPPPTPLASLPVEIQDGQIYLGGAA
jgi:Rieske Fe-S protein